MSRPTSRFPSRSLGCAAATLLIVTPWLHAQTIADYSRAQRAVLESAMTQSAERSAGSAAPASASAASMTAAAAPGRPAHSMAPSAAPSIDVSGVFSSSAGAIAEVLVNSTPYLLEAGERVPGTAWEVRAVGVDRVVLARLGTGVADDAGSRWRIFTLPAVR